MLHSPWNQDVNRIIVGCRKIVDYQENRLYDRNFRLPKASHSYLALLSINEHVVSNNQNRFRRKDVKDWLPDNLQSIHPSIINRHLRWYIKIDNLKREDSVRKRPGRHGKNDKEILSGPNKKSYSQTKFILSLQELVRQIAPRAIIYTVLRQSKIIERFLRLCEYKKLLKIKYTNVDKMINEIGPISESSFDKRKYNQQQNELQKKRKEILSMASETAKSTLSGIRLARYDIYPILHSRLLSSMSWFKLS